ncbi:hypothetical protein [Phenylobacterium sp.]|uniref:hypothetical protein n=1 Tax=Phenylobacterium sp. TaxID=1871053 RepID=UPI002FE19B48
MAEVVFEREHNDGLRFSEVFIGRKIPFDGDQATLLLEEGVEYVLSWSALGPPGSGLVVTTAKDGDEAKIRIKRKVDADGDEVADGRRDGVSIFTL